MGFLVPFFVSSSSCCCSVQHCSARVRWLAWLAWLAWLLLPLLVVGGAAMAQKFIGRILCLFQGRHRQLEKLFEYEPMVRYRIARQWNGRYIKIYIHIITCGTILGCDAELISLPYVLMHGVRVWIYSEYPDGWGETTEMGWGNGIAYFICFWIMKRNVPVLIRQPGRERERKTARAGGEARSYGMGWGGGGYDGRGGLLRYITEWEWGKGGGLEGAKRIKCRGSGRGGSNWREVNFGVMVFCVNCRCV